MKIGILTFHCAINYGALLQTYGLQEYLKHLGHDVFVINYRPKYLLKPYKVFNWEWWPSLSVCQNVYFLIRAILALPIRLKRKRRFTLFAQSNLNLCSPDFSNLYSAFDAYIFGSDQIWNPQITEGFDKIYFGCFPAAEGKKRIAYAASAGSVCHLISEEKEFLSFMSSYTAISVREKFIADFVNARIRGMQAEVVLDPVLLAGRGVFERVALQERSNKKYLLVFRFCCNDTSIIRKVAEAIAEKQNLEIVELLPDSEVLKNREIITTASLGDFIALFRDASHIVTTSYHGTVFSILFEKDFHVINSSHSERMVNLLSSIGLQRRLIDNETGIISEKIKYGQVNKQLEKMRWASQSFLNRALAKNE